jgi:GNAT superfamily N-acetyltransferase
MSETVAHARARGICLATPEERQSVLACITGAFICDPIARFAWPALHEYLAGMPRIAHAYARRSFDHGAVHRASDWRGAALWLPPRVGPDADAAQRLLEETVSVRRRADLAGIFEEMDAWRPVEPHWYLPLIGVDPHAQGCGLGSVLLQIGLERCDTEGLPAYLESSNPRNLSLYRRHGFEVMGTIQVGAAPPVRPMLRPPRAASA